MVNLDGPEQVARGVGQGPSTDASNLLYDAKTSVSAHSVAKWRRTTVRPVVEYLPKPKVVSSAMRWAQESHLALFYLV